MARQSPTSALLAVPARSPKRDHIHSGCNISTGESNVNRARDIPLRPESMAVWQGMMMKKMALAIGMALISTAASAQYAHEVQGYTRSDGTYVAPHMQTNPNGNAYDNYSSRPNVNPYTGQTGTVNPYEAQQQIDANRAQSSYGNPHGW